MQTAAGRERGVSLVLLKQALCSIVFRQVSYNRLNVEE
jgi:hypothetical protein